VEEKGGEGALKEGRGREWKRRGREEAEWWRGGELGVGDEGK